MTFIITILASKCMFGTTVVTKALLPLSGLLQYFKCFQL